MSTELIQKKKVDVINKFQDDINAVMRKYEKYFHNCNAMTQAGNSIEVAKFWIGRTVMSCPRDEEFTSGVLTNKKKIIV